MKKTVHFFVTLFGFISRSILNFLIFLIVGGLSGLLTFQFVNRFTDNSYGVDNLVVMLTAFTFFPLLNSFFIIFYMKENKKRNKNQRNKKKEHLEV